MQNKLFIPKRIKVGFQTRMDTFTGKLAYVIYYDEKGKLRKEKSWTTWCDSKIESVEFDNTPHSGFIFNKGVQRFHDWSGSGRSVFRLYAPHDFEFEIGPDNLINLLMHSDVSKREILEECVFAWYGTDLVLLPVNSAEYQTSLEFTQLQSDKLSAKNLVKGLQYKHKKNETVYTYIGYFDWYDLESNYKSLTSQQTRSNTKKHIFYSSTGSFTMPAISSLSLAISDDINPEYASLVDAFFGTINSQPIVDVLINTSFMNMWTDEHCPFDWGKWKYASPVFVRRVRNELYGIPTHDIFVDGFLHDRMWNHNKFVGWDINSFDSFSYTNKSQDSGYYNRYYKTTSLSCEYMTKEITDYITSQVGDDLSSVTTREFCRHIIQLGYGLPYFVLQNGRTVPCLGNKIKLTQPQE